MEEAYNTQVLPNGVRIVTEHVPSVRSASLGIWVAVSYTHLTLPTNSLV